MRATRRRTARHFVSSVSSRGAAWCGTHAVGLRPPSSPSAPPPLRGRGGMFAWCHRFRPLVPLRVTVVRCAPPRSAAGGLPLVPFGHSPHLAASPRVSNEPHRTGRYRHACGAESMRELASLRSAVSAGRDGGVFAGGSRRVSVWVRYRHAFGAEPYRIVTKNWVPRKSDQRRKLRSAKGRHEASEARVPALRVSRSEERSDSANMTPKVASGPGAGTGPGDDAEAQRNGEQRPRSGESEQSRRL